MEFQFRGAMKIDYNYLRRYYGRMAIEQIADEYRSRGYEVTKNYPIEGSDFRADLLAVKGDEKIIIEVKADKLNANSKRHLAELAKYISTLEGYKFRVAIVTPPKNREIIVEGLEEALLDEMNCHLPDELDSLASHARVEEVSEIDVQKLSVEGICLNCKGSGIVSVELQYGSDGDCRKGDGWETTMSFPFSFDITVTMSKNGIEELEVNEMNIDTSDFYC